MADGDPIRVVVCGKSEEVGRGVIAGLQPEVEVIHFGLSPAALAEELPAVLGGRAPASSSSELGTRRYKAGRPPRAVVFGGAWDGDDVEAVHAVTRGLSPGGEAVVMLRHDRSKVIPAAPGTPEYGAHIVARVKEVLARLVASGEGVEWAADGVAWY